MFNEMMGGTYGMKLQKAALAVLGLLALYLAVLAITGIAELRYVGTGIPANNVISVNGTGEAFAVPDVGEFTFSVVSKKTTVAAAQADATAKINAVMAYLKDAGIAQKDIKTVGYNVYPQYDYRNRPCYSPANGEAYYCPDGEQVLTGYEVRQTTQVQVRDTEKAGELLAGVGDKGATEVSGLNFTVEDESAVAKEARDKAIADANIKAKELAAALGVRLVRIVSFSEDSGGYPVYYDKAMGFGGGAAPSAVPEISVGENKVTSQVYISWEIR